MIENDLKQIKKVQTVSRTKTEKSLRTISNWQAKHAKQNNAQFSAIKASLATIPTQEAILETITVTIKSVVNGKIDTLNSKVDMVGEHLKQQDANLEVLSNKIKPIDGAREWLSDTGKIVLYIGAIAVAVAGVVELLQLFHII